MSPPWTPPRRRRVASHEPAVSWLDVRFVVDVTKDEDGRRDLHLYLHVWDRSAHIAVSLRHLVFWLALLLLLVPTGAFQMTPRMPGMATRAASVASAGFTTPSRCGTPTEFLSEMDNFTTLGLGNAAAFDSFGFDCGVSDTRKLLDVASSPVAEGFESSAEALYEEFDQCILDAESDSDFTACLEQVHSSSLDELSGVIVKEGCDLFSSEDDGTVVGLLGQVLHTVKEEGIEAALDVMSLRRLALRACVSASLHKVTVCVLPTVSACMVRVAPEVGNVIHALVS